MGQNDVSLILLALFILWNKLQNIFNGCEVLLEKCQNYCNNIWEDISKNLKEYTLYATKNILQLEKS